MDIDVVIAPIGLKAKKSKIVHQIPAIAHEFEDINTLTWKSRSFFMEHAFCQFGLFKLAMVFDKRTEKHFLLLFKDLTEASERANPLKKATCMRIDMVELREIIRFMDKIIGEIDAHGKSVDLLPMLKLGPAGAMIDVAGQNVGKRDEFWAPDTALVTTSGKFRIRPCRQMGKMK